MKAISRDGSNDLVTSHLDPRYRYLRVQALQGAPALLVLGYVDPHPMGPIEVWYSASGEVLKLQNGRVVATQGLTLDWPSVRYEQSPLPLTELGSVGSRYERVRDEVPRYRFGVREAVLVQQTAQIPRFDEPGALAPALPGRYRWYQETVQGPPGYATVSWFAVGTRRGAAALVFSEQCMDLNQCLRIQPWPVDEDPL